MKKAILICVLLLSYSCIFSQDIIIKTNNDTIYANIISRFEGGIEYQVEGDYTFKF